MINTTGAALYPRQREIAESCINSTAMYHIIDAGRQTGKSFMCKQLLLYFGFNNRNWRCMYVSMTLQQSEKVFNEILGGIDGTGVVQKVNRERNYITLISGSTIYFRSYERCDTIRGEDLDLLIVDEAAYCRDVDWYSVLRPTMTVRGKKCILCSTPRGYNFFRDMYMDGLEGGRYMSYKTTYASNPYANMEEVEDARKKLPPKIFAAEFLGEFIADGMSVFENVRNCTHAAGVIPPADGKRYYAGIDVGRQNDYTVLTVMTEGGDVAIMKRWNQENWNVIADKVAAAMMPYDPITYIEINGVGDVFFDVMKDKCKRIGKRNMRMLNTWKTTNESKTDIIDGLIYSFATGDISIPNDPELLLELDGFEASYSKATRAVTYGGRNGIHDDMVMSLAITNYIRVNKRNHGNYNICVL